MLNILSERPVSKVIVAGWAGRDPMAVRHHIDELAVIGVPPPSRTPLFYQVAPDRVTQDTVVTVLGSGTSGEVEPVLIWTDSGIVVGVGSDHTDRETERHGVAISKQLCPKVVGTQFWSFDEVEPRWDSLVLRSWRETAGRSVLYQEGALSELLPPSRLIEQYREAGGRVGTGSVMFCGTVPTIGGIARADAMAIELFDPMSGHSLCHRYDVVELALVA